MPGGAGRRPRCRFRYVALICVAGLLAGIPAAQADAPDLASVAETVDQALDQADGPRVLAVLADAAVAAPQRAADLAAMGTRLAPWMAAEVAVAVLEAVPAKQRGALASEVLAAVLTAGDGRLGGEVLAAVGRAAPWADPVTLQDLARRLSVDGMMAVDGDLLLGDLAVDGASEPVLGAVRRARQADLGGRQIISRLPPRGRQDRVVGPDAPVPDLPRPVEAGNSEPRLVDPRWIASPS